MVRTIKKLFGENNIVGVSFIITPSTRIDKPDGATYNVSTPRSILRG